MWFRNYNYTLSSGSKCRPIAILAYWAYGTCRNTSETREKTVNIKDMAVPHKPCTPDSNLMRYEAVWTGIYLSTLAEPCNFYPEAEDRGCRFLLNVVNIYQSTKRYVTKHLILYQQQRQKLKRWNTLRACLTVSHVNAEWISNRSSFVNTPTGNTVSG